MSGPRGPWRPQDRPMPPGPPRGPGHARDWDNLPPGPQAGAQGPPPRSFDRRGPEDRRGPPPGAPGREMSGPRGPWRPQDRPMPPGPPRGPGHARDWDNLPPGPHPEAQGPPPRSFDRRGPEDRRGPPPGTPGHDMSGPRGPWRPQDRPMPPGPPRGPGHVRDWDNLPPGPQAGAQGPPPRSFDRRGPEDRRGPPPGAPGREMSGPRGPWRPQDRPMPPGPPRGPGHARDWDNLPPGPHPEAQGPPPRSFDRRGPEDRRGPPPGAPGHGISGPRGPHGPWAPQDRPLPPGPPRGPGDARDWDNLSPGPQAGAQGPPPRGIDRRGPPPGAQGRDVAGPRAPRTRWAP
jgi:hypothetical protein